MVRGRARLALLLVLACAAGGCTRQSAIAFRVDNARAHVERLAGTIGGRPLGTAANAAARAYLIDQLRLYGFEVRVQEGDAFDPRTGYTARLANIIAVKAGERPDALALVAHYDSLPDAPGAMDNGIGVAVSLEAARLLAARPRPRHSLIVLLTDGEEAGLLGAAYAITDSELRSRIRAYLNLDSTGATGPGILFESGPGNEPLIRAWARSPRPRGSSFAFEIYRRLPNDTDFSVFRRAEIPGLNFAPVGDSYGYHTTRDLPHRVSSATLFHMGETAVATIEALDEVELSAARRDLRFSDLLSRTVLTLTDQQARVLLVAACLLALVAWIRMIRAVVAAGVLHAVFTLLWGVLSCASASGAMVLAVWLLRGGREVYHPWYAHPWRLLALLVACGVAAPWAVTRLARLLPRPVRYVRGPESVWAVALPVWAAIAVAAEVYAPAAAHLWSLPLAAAGLLLALLPVARTALVRAASLVILLVVLTVFLRDGLVLFGFLVALFGRLPVVTPVAVYPALLTLLGLFMAPPLIAAAIGLIRGRLRHGVTGSLLLATLAVTTALAFAGEAYTPDRPMRREALYLDDRVAGRALWEVAGNEPGLDLDLAAVDAAAWRPLDRAAQLEASVPVGRPQGAFGFRRPGVPAPPPAALTLRQVPAAEAPGLVEFELAVRPAEEGLSVGLLLPPGLVPSHASPAGIEAGGRWRATYLGVPAGGVAFRGRVAAGAAAALAHAAVVVGSSRLPGEGGSPPRWLPRTRTDWRTRAIWILPLAAAAPALDPPTALR